VISSRGWDLKAVADAFVSWLRSRPVDIGNTCRRGICRYIASGTLSAPPSVEDGGNGAAMRNLPTVLATLHDLDALAERSLQQAHITHHHRQSDAATVALARMTRCLLLGGDRPAAEEIANALVAEEPAFRFRPYPRRAGGYIVETVQTVFDGFFSTDNFRDCLVRVVNQGGDADTTGALAGQLAGALYGIDGIPAQWLKKLDPGVAAAIQLQVKQLLALSGFPS
jgi:ADP-ribosyl-[dinitrogen reductase] hydrolase